MRTADIIRLETSYLAGTFGALLVDGEAFGCTLEPYEYGNLPFSSCIPPGQYVCERYDSPKFGETFLILHVPNRDLVMFHPGNVVENTEGCPCIGEHFGKLKGDRAVLNSGKTFDKFMAAMAGVDRFRVSIHTPMWG